MNLTASPPIAAAFSSFVDYAGLFPPAELALADAAAEYDAARAGSYAWMLGRFVVPASRTAAAAAAIARPAALAVIADRPLDELVGLRENGMAALEIALPALRVARDTYDAPIGQFAAMRAKLKLDDLPAYVEVPRDARWREELVGVSRSLARHRLYAKIRCGGATADAFPTCGEMAWFLRAMAEEGVAFKATAGLHHPVRRVDPQTGFHMHGFVNLLVASLLTLQGEGGAVEDALADEDAGAFAFEGADLRWRSYRFDAAQIARARGRGFVGYGSCSFAEPVEDLTTMHVLEEHRS